MWHIGQKVIYIGTDPLYPKGVREIQGLMKFPCCGVLNIDTGVKIPSTHNQQIMDCSCGARNIPVYGVYWKFESLFRPVDFAEDVIAEIEKQVKEETVKI